MSQSTFELGVTINAEPATDLDPQSLADHSVGVLMGCPLLIFGKFLETAIRISKMVERLKECAEADHW